MEKVAVWGATRRYCATAASQRNLNEQWTYFQKSAKRCLFLNVDQSFIIPSKAEVVFDSIGSVKGPLCGILSAMQAFPQAHWLVLACDLPFVTLSTLEKIITSFHASDPRLTAYRSSSDGLPEPLCAIYPIGCNKVLLDTSRKTGNYCPRKLL